MDEFVEILAEAEELVEQPDPAQAEVETMTSRLAVAMAKLRLIPDTTKLEELIEKTKDYTDAKVVTLREEAIALLAERHGNAGRGGCACGCA